MPTTTPSSLWNLADTCAYLNTTERHVRYLVFNKQIPTRRVGRLLRFDPGEIRSWVDATLIDGDPA